MAGAQKLLCVSLVALWQVGSYLPNQIKLVSSALQGGFLTTGPPEKSSPGHPALESRSKPCIGYILWFLVT